MEAQAPGHRSAATTASGTATVTTENVPTSHSVVAPQLQPGDRLPMHFVRSVGQTQRAR